MEFVPLVFCDSVTFLSFRADLAKLQLLASCWGKSAARTVDRRLELDFNLSASENDTWTCEIMRNGSPQVFYDISELDTDQNQAYTLFTKLTVSFQSNFQRSAVPAVHQPIEPSKKTKRVTTAELNSTIIPFIKARLPPQAAFKFPTDFRANQTQLKQIVEWFSDVRFHRLSVRINPGMEGFITKQLASRNVKHLHLSGGASATLTTTISEWIRRNIGEFEYVNVSGCTSIKIDVSVFTMLFNRWLDYGLPPKFVLSGTAKFGYSKFSQLVKCHQQQAEADYGNNIIWWRKFGSVRAETLEEKDAERRAMGSEERMQRDDFLKATLGLQQNIKFCLDPSMDYLVS